MRLCAYPNNASTCCGGVRHLERVPVDHPLDDTGVVVQAARGAVEKRVAALRRALRPFLAEEVGLDGAANRFARPFLLDGAPAIAIPPTTGTAPMCNSSPAPARGWDLDQVRVRDRLPPR